MLRTTHLRLGVFIAAASLVACLDQATEPSTALHRSVASDTSSPSDTSTPPDTTTPPDTAPPDTTTPPDTAFAGIIRGFVIGVDSSFTPPRIAPLMRAELVVRLQRPDSLRAVVRWNTRTDSTGAFLFAGLPRGVYILDAHAPRFGKVRLPGIVPGASIPTTPALTIYMHR